MSRRATHIGQHAATKISALNFQNTLRVFMADGELFYIGQGPFKENTYEKRRKLFSHSKMSLKQRNYCSIVLCF